MIAVDLCCGLGGWTEGLLAEGYRVRGYDIEEHVYGDERYPAELVLKNLHDMHGSECADADLIVASPVCTEFSYMAMPWKRAKKIGRALRGEDDFPEGYTGSRTLEELTALFDACFRIQREASEARGEKIPMVVENVRGAQPWLGKAQGNYGSYYLWGDVPPLPSTKAVKNPGHNWSKFAETGEKSLQWNEGSGRKIPGFRFDGSGRSFQTAAVRRGHDVKRNAATLKAQIEANAHLIDVGRKAVGSGRAWFTENQGGFSSKSNARKEATARIAKIPLTLSRHVALYWAMFG